MGIVSEYHHKTPTNPAQNRTHRNPIVPRTQPAVHPDRTPTAHASKKPTYVFICFEW